MIGAAIGGLFGLAIFAFIVWCYLRIIRHAGYSGWWVLIMFVPIANFVMVWVFAFSNWPALARAGGGGGGPRFDPPRVDPPRGAGGPAPAADAAPPRRDAGPVEGGTMISGQRAAPPVRPRADAGGDVTWVLSGFDGEGQAVRLMVAESRLRQAADGIVIGRSPEQADLVISDQSVSRKHALLRLKSGDLAIEDLDSANGTVIDGRVIKAGRPVPLDAGAQIELGAVRLTLSKG